MWRMLLATIIFSCAGSSLKGADVRPNSQDVSGREINKKLGEIIQNSKNDKKSIRNNADQILKWLHYNPSTDVQYLCEDALSRVVAPEIRDGLIAILLDKNANQGSRYSQAWGALCAQSEIVSDKQVKDFLAEYERFGPHRLFELAARARIEPETRDAILKKLESGNIEDQKCVIEFIAIQLGLYENMRPGVQLSEAVRQKYIRLVSLSAKAQWDYNYMAGWVLIELGEPGGYASVCAQMKQKLAFAKQKKLSLDNLTGYILKLESFTKKKFCEVWPKEEEEREKVIMAWLGWLEEQDAKENKSLPPGPSDAPEKKESVAKP